jgi:hypothetical protein
MLNTLANPADRATVMVKARPMPEDTPLWPNPVRPPPNIVRSICGYFEEYHEPFGNTRGQISRALFIIRDLGSAWFHCEVSDSAEYFNYEGRGFLFGSHLICTLAETTSRRALPEEMVSYCLRLPTDSRAAGWMFGTMSGLSGGGKERIAERPAAARVALMKVGEFDDEPADIRARCSVRLPAGTNLESALRAEITGYISSNPISWPTKMKERLGKFIPRSIRNKIADVPPVLLGFDPDDPEVERKRPGPEPKLRRAVSDAMIEDIRVGTITLGWLRGAKVKDIVEKYRHLAAGKSAITAARDEVLGR